MANSFQGNGQELVPAVTTSITLSAISWSLVGGLYQYTYLNAAIQTNSIVTFVPNNSTIAIVIAAQLLPEVDVTAGQAILYAKALPTGDISVNMAIGA